MHIKSYYIKEYLLRVNHELNIYVPHNVFLKISSCTPFGTFLGGLTISMQVVVWKLWSYHAFRIRRNFLYLALCISGCNVCCLDPVSAYGRWTNRYEFQLIWRSRAGWRFWAPWNILLGAQPRPIQCPKFFIASVTLGPLQSSFKVSLWPLSYFINGHSKNNPLSILHTRGVYYKLNTIEAKRDHKRSKQMQLSKTRTNKGSV